MQSKGIFGGGNCQLPLQVTTVIYGLHSNQALGAQRNMLVRGVPATVYDEGRAIEIYTGRVAIDVFSDTFAHALQASDELYPLNAPGSPTAQRCRRPSTAPACTEPVTASIARVMASLPDHVCQTGRRRRRPTPRPSPANAVANRARGAAGLPMSRRRLRNAIEPISAGTHSEIAR